jgi:hypothetical protein
MCVLEVMYLCVRVIDFASFYDFDICYNSVVFFVFHFIHNEEIIFMGRYLCWWTINP